MQSGNIVIHALFSSKNHGVVDLPVLSTSARFYPQLSLDIQRSYLAEYLS